MNDEYVRKAEVVRILDADTLELRVDLGYRVYSRVLVRVRGYNAAELPTVEGWAALNKATRILESGQITVKSYKDHMSFARWICDLWIDGQSFAELMVKP
jgi:endonuclease YncB( thermonuclease family)